MTTDARLREALATLINEAFEDGAQEREEHSEGVTAARARVEALFAELVGKVEQAHAALMAMRTMMDRGPKPQKLDAALTWKQNDEMARKMCDEAIAAIDAARKEGA